ncbi:hypothetical protein [Brevibacillus choshinensis]|uniref:hypothetical protein n=1 Tax=Brevibacillus choshinensis TaxID=54911 RepID=UPI000AC2A80B|nr:hypothetical protein [Brevibacillus choshinensis]
MGDLSLSLAAGISIGLLLLLAPQKWYIRDQQASMPSLINSNEIERHSGTV